MVSFNASMSLGASKALESELRFYWASGNAPFPLIPGSSSYFLQDFVPKKSWSFLRTCALASFGLGNSIPTMHWRRRERLDSLDRSGLSSKLRRTPFIGALGSVSDKGFLPSCVVQLLYHMEPFGAQPR